MCVKLICITKLVDRLHIVLCMTWRCVTCSDQSNCTQITLLIFKAQLFGVMYAIESLLQQYIFDGITAFYMHLRVEGGHVMQDLNSIRIL